MTGLDRAAAEQWLRVREEFGEGASLASTHLRAALARVAELEDALAASEARCAELERAQDGCKRTMLAAVDATVPLNRTIAALRAKVARLREAERWILERAVHIVGCGWCRAGDPDACDCGLQQVKAALARSEERDG